MSTGIGSVKAAIVTVGDELLLGQTVDTNAAWMGRELASMGLPVVRRWTVGDDSGDIRWAVGEALASADLVLVTGGLGPTPDDFTRDVVADLLGRPLTEDPEILEAMRVRYRDRGIGRFPEINRRIAQVPEGARKLGNPYGAAPGLAMETEGAVVVLFPGVPRELHGIVEGDFRALVLERFGDRVPPVHLHVVHTTGIAESRLSEEIAERLPGGTEPAGLAFLPDLRGVDVRFTFIGTSAEDAAHHVRRLESVLRDVLAPWRFECASGDLAEAVADALRARGKTLAVAESCTGGLVTKRLTDFPGASEVLAGGVVAYANAVKKARLGVEQDLLDRAGAVSEEVARQMALGVAESLGADAGIGVTGVAGPSGGTDEKPVGTVWYAATLDGRSVARRERFPGDREAVRERAAQAALFLLLRLLDGRVAGDG
jgi:competence/damage-inducible protein CinA-like protein